MLCRLRKLLWYLRLWWSIRGMMIRSAALVWKMRWQESGRGSFRNAVYCDLGDECGRFATTVYYDDGRVPPDLSVRCPDHIDTPP